MPGPTNSIKKADWSTDHWSKSTVIDGMYYIGEFGFWIGMERDSGTNVVFSHFEPESQSLLIYPGY